MHHRTMNKNMSSNLIGLRNTARKSYCHLCDLYDKLQVVIEIHCQPSYILSQNSCSIKKRCGPNYESAGLHFRQTDTQTDTHRHRRKLIRGYKKEKKYNWS